jgi:hypothetical protein
VILIIDGVVFIRVEHLLAAGLVLAVTFGMLGAVAWPALGWLAHTFAGRADAGPYEFGDLDDGMPALHGPAGQVWHTDLHPDRHPLAGGVR